MSPLSGGSFTCRERIASGFFKYTFLEINCYEQDYEICVKYDFI